MIRAGERMEFWYGHWFDAVVENEQVEECFDQVARHVHRLDQVLI